MAQIKGLAVELKESELKLIRISADNGVAFLHYSIDLLSERYNTGNCNDIYDAYIMQTSRLFTPANIED